MIETRVRAMPGRDVRSTLCGEDQATVAEEMGGCLGRTWGLCMHGIAGAVVEVMAVVVMTGGGGRSRSKLKTGWTGSIGLDRRQSRLTCRRAKALCG